MVSRFKRPKTSNISKHQNRTRLKNKKCTRLVCIDQTRQNLEVKYLFRNENEAVSINRRIHTALFVWILVFDKGPREKNRWLLHPYAKEVKNINQTAHISNWNLYGKCPQISETIRYRRLKLAGHVMRAMNQPQNLCGNQKSNESVVVLTRPWKQ